MANEGCIRSSSVRGFIGDNVYALPTGDADLDGMDTCEHNAGGMHAIRTLLLRQPKSMPTTAILDAR